MFFNAEFLAKGSAALLSVTDSDVKDVDEFSDEEARNPANLCLY